MQKKYALISVSDAAGIETLAASLVKAGFSILATSGTAKKLRTADIAAEDVGAHTGYPELFGGRVKTLHPLVHGGILYRRGNVGDEKEAKAHAVAPIDIVVANLYPFEKTVAAKAPHAECIENIDIGGVALIRSAGKNQAHVTVVTDTADYARVAAAAARGITPKLRAELAAKAFAYTARYDTAIAAYLAQQAGVPMNSGELVPKAPARTLRYGENPHQKAMLYGDLDRVFKQLHGKELSYNNMLDIASARGLIREFEGDRPTVAILKHTNPCGVGRAASPAKAWELAYATDRSAPFGGVVVINVRVDRATAKKMSELFLEIVLAPAFDADALALLSTKKSIRLVTYRPEKKGSAVPAWQLRSIGEGLVLGEDDDRAMLDEKTLKTVSKRGATKREREAMLFAWKVAKHVKSNAVVYASADRTLGIGAGQMSRVDSSRIAIRKAADAKLSLKGCAVASDAFLPFPDTLVAAAKAGATALIQPGGSIKDDAVIAAADKHKMAMIFTGVRHFKH